jgi:hypothetical protein
MADLKLKQDSSGNVLVTLPDSGIQVAMRSPKGRDVKAVQKLADGPGKLSDYEIGLALTLMCITTWDTVATSVTPVTTDQLDDLTIRDLDALDKAMLFFRPKPTGGEENVG